MGDLTNNPTLRRSKRLSAGRSLKRYGITPYHVVQEHISNTDRVPRTYTKAVDRRFSKEWMKECGSKIASLETDKQEPCESSQRTERDPSKIVLHLKHSGNGKFIGHEIRLVASVCHTNTRNRLPGSPLSSIKICISMIHESSDCQLRREVLEIRR